MGLEAIIAQRIASAAAMRNKLYDPSAIGAGLQQFAGNLQESKIMGARAQQAQATDMEGVPSPVAGLVADNLIPGNAPDRKGRVDALISALGASGGAKLLAKLSAYTALFNNNNRDAFNRLKLGYDLADGTLGRPPAAPRAVGGGGVGGGADISGDIDLINKADNLDALLGIDLPNFGDPRVRSAFNAKRGVLSTKGVGDRFDKTYSFNREKWTATLANINADNKRADDAFAAGRADEARQIRRAAAGAADAAVSDFIQDHGDIRVTKKVMALNPATGEWVDTTTTVIDPSVLPEEAQNIYKALVGTRDSLRQKVVGEPQTPGASPPAGGAVRDAKGQYQWIGGWSGTDIVITDTPTPPGRDFKPYTPPGGTSKQTTTIADYNAPPRMGEYAAPLGEPKRIDTSLPRTGEPKRVEEQTTKDPAAEALKAALRKALGK